MAYINVDEVYILDNTGLQVDMATDIPFADAGFTDAQKEQARKNIAAGGSNPNLLDNAYFVGGGSQLGDGVFPINQRGLTSYTSQDAFDRWKVDGNVTVTLQSGNIRVQASAAYVGLYQVIPMSMLKNGETYTFSIILDGNMVTQTFVLNADGNWNNIYYGDDWYIPYVCANGVCQFKVVNSISSFDHTIEAVKLEKGTVSTLANDVPPDFGEELRKCQRYLRDVSLKRTPCYFDGTYSVAVLTLTGIEMAKSPTPSLITAGFAWQPAASASANLTAVSLITFEQYTPTIQFNLATALSGMGMIYDTVIRLSCEL